jgi:hypothetical protein
MDEIIAPAVVDPPPKATRKRPAYNRKCKNFRIYWHVGLFHFTVLCNQPTHQGALYCEKHQEMPECEG